MHNESGQIFGNERAQKFPQPERTQNYGEKTGVSCKIIHAYENNAQVVETAEEGEANIAAQNMKLSLHDAVIPDAFKIKSRCIEESVDVRHFYFCRFT